MVSSVEKVIDRIPCPHSSGLLLDRRGKRIPFRMSYVLDVDMTLLMSRNIDVARRNVLAVEHYPGGAFFEGYEDRLASKNDGLHALVGKHTRGIF